MTPLRRVVNRVLAWSLPVAGAVVGLATAAVVVPGDEPAAAAPITPIVVTSTSLPSPIVGSVPAPAPPTTATTTSTTTAPAPPPPDDLAPTRVRIAKIDVDANIIDLGINPDRTLEVPKDFDDTGWYTGRSVPGEVGPSVVVGHVDSARYGPAVFYRLRELSAGDTVEIDRSDGTVAVFRITHSVLVYKSEFPTQDVYGLTDAPELRLITCGGSFVNGSHTKNLIHYGVHLGNFDSSTDLRSLYGSGPDNPFVGHRV